MVPRVELWGRVVTASDAPRNRHSAQIWWTSDDGELNPPGFPRDASDGYTIDPRARAAILQAITDLELARKSGPRDAIMAARDRVLALVDGLAQDAFLSGRQHPVRLYDADAEGCEPDSLANMTSPCERHHGETLRDVPR